MQAIQVLDATQIITTVTPITIQVTKGTLEVTLSERLENFFWF